MSNFDSLLFFGQSLGLGKGLSGVCHLVELSMEMLLPKDVEAGRIPAEFYCVYVYDYGTHRAFQVRNGDEALSNEVVVYTYEQLHQLLIDVFVAPDVYHAAPSNDVEPINEEEDELLEERLEAMRLEALNADVVDGSNDDDDYEYEEDDSEYGDDEPNLDEDESNAVDDVVEEDDADSAIITMTKPDSKPNSKKYTQELSEMADVLNEYYPEECEELGDDLIEVLREVFKESDSFEFDTSLTLLEQLSDFIEFE